MDAAPRASGFSPIGKTIFTPITSVKGRVNLPELGARTSDPGPQANENGEWY